MSGTPTEGQDPQAEDMADEAATWLARLNSRTVGTADLEAFFAWRRMPGHAETYDRLEAHWRQSLDLSGDPDIAAAVTHTLATEAQPRRKWTSPQAAIAAVLIVLAACASFLLITRDTIYETATGEQRLVRLEDGTRVHLDTDTRLRVASGGSRTLVLEKGRALFGVAHDPQNPFSVTTRHTRVIALGTSFEVEQIGDEVAVAMVEGKVAVEMTPPAKRGAVLKLSAGQAVRVSPGGPGQITAADTGMISAWTRGRLEFRDTPLASAIAEVNRYTRTKLALKSRQWAEQRVNGGFAVGDSEAFIDAVTALYPLRAVTLTDGTVELHDR